jgi:predicted metal-dependent HD superfamily phosphohydrolase
MSSNPNVSRLELNSVWHDLAVARRWRDYPQSPSYAKAASVGWGLLDRFEEPHRAYHNSLHVLALLQHAADAAELVSDPHKMALAIWFHDAIYDPKAQDNEAQSAALARTNLMHLGEKDPFVADIEAMILATVKHQLPENAAADLKLFLDFDLSILGSTPETYATYAAAIRAEYAFVPDEVYQPGRRAVLENFLKRPELYFTDHGKQKWEKVARENLAGEIARLG